MYVAIKVASIYTLTNWRANTAAKHKLSKNWKPGSRFPPIKDLTNAGDKCLHIINTATKSSTPKNLVSRFPPIQELANAVWPMSSCNVHHESTVSGRGASTVALCIFLYMQLCRVTAFSYINLTNSPLLLNGYLESIVSGQGRAGYHCTAQLPLFTIVLGNRFRYLSLSL